MVARLVLVLYLCVARGVLFILEQPQGSTAAWHPRLQDFFRNHTVYRATCVHEQFGGDTSKPFWLYCMDPRIQTISNFKTSEGKNKLKLSAGTT